MQIFKPSYWLAMIVITLFSTCQSKKGEIWLSEHQPFITTIITPTDLPIYTGNILDTRLGNLKYYQKELSTVVYNNLSDSAKIRFLDLQHQINLELFKQDTLNIFHWDATLYRITNYIRKVENSTRPTEKRFQQINSILMLSDSFYQAAKNNIVSTISIKNSKQAIHQHTIDFLYLKNEVSYQVENSEINEYLKAHLTTNLNNTLLNFKDYIGYITSMVNNTDDLGNTTTIIDKNIDEFALSMQKYLGYRIAHFDTTQNPVSVVLPEDIAVLERTDFYFSLAELDELEQNGSSFLFNILIFLAQKELGKKHQYLTIPFQKLLDGQKANMATYPYRYVAQWQNYLSYKAYKNDLENKNENDKLMALKNYIQQFRDTPFIFIKKVLEV